MGEKGELDLPEDDEVARRLNFSSPNGSGARGEERHRHQKVNSSSPGQAAKVRDPLHRRNNGQHGKKRERRKKSGKFGMGLLATLMVWMLCIACLGVMAWLNWDRFAEISMKGMTIGTTSVSGVFHVVYTDRDLLWYGWVPVLRYLVHGRQPISHQLVPRKLVQLPRGGHRGHNHLFTWAICARPLCPSKPWL